MIKAFIRNRLIPQNKKHKNAKRSHQAKRTVTVERLNNLSNLAPIPI